MVLMLLIIVLIDISVHGWGCIWKKIIDILAFILLNNFLHISQCKVGLLICSL